MRGAPDRRQVPETSGAFPRSWAALARTETGAATLPQVGAGVAAARLLGNVGE